MRRRSSTRKDYPVEPGEAGYLHVKGDSAAAYYWRNHEKTKATMQGEWMFAGDWYRMDEDGFYWYEGRADDMIKVSGLWVSPVEVEDTLGDHESVMEAAAVGVPVDGLTRVKAFVVLARWLPGLRRTSRGVADLVQGEPQTLPVPAHSGVYRGAAEDGDGQDPTLQAPRA